jgi:uncharacterized membrane protein YgcG
VRHEALAIRRQRERVAPASDDPVLIERLRPEPPSHELAERYDRLRLGAEALRRLKPQEVRCILLRAEGYSYQQICDETGYSYTKVNRCLTEGRRAFLERVAGIESGIECERLAPLVSALVDGEATAEDMAALRPHLRGCLACRARIKEFRAAPARIAALIPGAVVVPAPGEPGLLGRALEWLAAQLQERTSGVGQRWHDAAEMASAPKVAAVAASTAALAGGGVAIVDSTRRAPAPERREHRAAHRHARPAALIDRVRPQRSQVADAPSRTRSSHSSERRAREARAAHSEAARRREQQDAARAAQPSPAVQEFGPEGAGSSGAAPAASSSSSAPSTGGRSSGGSSSSGGGSSSYGGAEEFAP